MSRRRAGTCREPGPYDYHCTLEPGHRWSCHDAGDDTSWNDRSPEDWQTDTPHDCGDVFCPDNATTPSRGDETTPGVGRGGEEGTT